MHWLRLVQKAYALKVTSLWGYQIRSKKSRSNLTIVFCEVSLYVFLFPTSSMQSYQVIQHKKIGTFTDSEKRDKFLN